MKRVNPIKLLIGPLKTIAAVPIPYSMSGAQDHRGVRGAYRIASIDDEEFPHKQRLRELGFQIDYYPRLSEISQTTRYAVYICDIMGVETDTLEDGVWTMKELRLRFPVAPLIGYTYLSPADLKYQSARQVCDTLLRKSSEIDEISEALDRYLLEINSPSTLWRRIRNHLLARGMATKEIAGLEHYFVKAVLNRDPESFADSARSFLSSGGTEALLADAVPLVAKSVGSALLKTVAGIPSH